MTDDPGPPLGAGEDFDTVDLAILDDVGRVYAELDPVPEDLAARSAFALDLVGLEDEIARLATDALQAAGSRSTEQSRTITFDSASLTIVVQASGHSSGTMRLDGWLAPADVRPVLVRTGKREFRTESDELGRFVLLGVPRGMVQIVVGAAGGDPDAASAGDGSGADSGAGYSVITPAVVL